LQQLATANISTKVVVLSLFATPFILLFGYMYHKAAHVKFGAAMYKASAAAHSQQLAINPSWSTQRTEGFDVGSIVGSCGSRAQRRHAGAAHSGCTDLSCVVF
jgi:hypothetical protein